MTASKKRKPQALTDEYVRKCLLRRFKKLEVKRQEITPEMIEFKRVQLECKRTLKEFRVYLKRRGKK